MPLSPGDKLGPYEILSPIGAGGIQPLTRTTGVIVGSMTRQEGGVAGGAKANSEIHIMHTTGAMPYQTLALVQQPLGNGFKSWIVGNPSIIAFDHPALPPKKN
jgi:hypothetical protein